MLLAKIAITLGLIAFIVIRVDLTETLETIRGASLLPLLAALAVLVLQNAVCGTRWNWILQRMGGHLSYASAIRFFWSAAFFGNVLPSVGADVLRTWAAYRARIPISVAVNSVILDRVAAMFALILTAALPQIVAAHPVPGLPPWWAFAGLLGLAVLGIVTLTLPAALPLRFHNRMLLRYVVPLSVAARRVFASPATALPLLMVSLLAAVILCVSAYLIALSLDIPIRFIDCLVLIPPAIIAATVPISIGGWGVREGAITLMFQLLNIPASAALGLSILLGLLAAISAVPGGIFWIMERRQPAP